MCSRTIPYIELIDTCWDVNDGSGGGGDFDISELIDTCWDVNSEVAKVVSDFYEN